MCKLQYFVNFRLNRQRFFFWLFFLHPVRINRNFGLTRFGLARLYCISFATITFLVSKCSSVSIVATRESSSLRSNTFVNTVAALLCSLITNWSRAYIGVSTAPAQVVQCNCHFHFLSR
jgi:hypothetical protein